MREVMNTREVAAYLDLSEKTILSMVQNNEMPGVKIRGKWRYPKAIVDLWLGSGARKNVKRHQAEKRQGQTDTRTGR